MIYRNYILVTLIWSLLLWPYQLLAQNSCPSTASNTEKILRQKDDFGSYEQFRKFEIEAESLLRKGRSGRSRLQIELAKPGVTIESILPDSAVGTAAYYQAFANFGNKGKVIDLGRILTGSTHSRGVAAEVKRLKAYLAKNPFMETTFKKDASGRVLLVPTQKNVKWYRAMERFATLSASIQQYARLGEMGGAGTSSGRFWHSKLVANKLTAGFMRFLKKRSGAEVQRRLVEEQLSRSNFGEALQIFGLYNKKSMSVRFRQSVAKYQNLYKNLFNAAFFGATIVGAQTAASHFGVPISIMSMIGPAWLAMGFIPLHYRYKMPLGSKRTQLILESVRENGYEKGIKPFKRSLFVHAGFTRGSKYLRRAINLGLLILIASWLEEHGETVYNGLMLARTAQQILANPEKLKAMEAMQNAEDIRTNLLEGKCLSFPIVFEDEYHIQPDNRYEWDRFLRSIAYCSKKILPDMVKLICQNKNNEPIKGYEQQEQYIERAYATIIEKNDYNPDFIRICAEQVFWLWQDADIDRDIRMFSNESVKEEIDFCEGKYKPAIFHSTDFARRFKESF